MKTCGSPIVYSNIRNSVTEKKAATKTSGQMNHLKNGKFGNAPDIDAGLTGERCIFEMNSYGYCLYTTLPKPF